MSKKQLPETREPQTLGVLAQYEGPEALTAAAAKLTDQGYKQVEAFSPFPIHGIDEALKAPAPLLPWVVLGAGLTGLFVALGMQYFMNAAPENAQLFGYYSPYQFKISGKPFFSLPANIPVTFELIILFSSLTTFFGMLAFNKLPTLSNPLFRSQRFRKATDNGFFLYIDAKDPKFVVGSATSALNGAGATAVETIEQEATGHTLPGMIHWVGAQHGRRAVAAAVDGRRRHATLGHAAVLDLLGHGLPGQVQAANADFNVNLCRWPLRPTACARDDWPRRDAGRYADVLGH